VAARTASIALFFLLVATMAPALGHETDPAIAALSEESLYVEAGAGAVDESEILDAIGTARDYGINLRVAVFASGGDAEHRASDIAASLDSPTVLVFTPDSYGVYSDEISQGRLRDALSDAESELSGPDEAAGVSAFAAALDPDRSSGGVSVGVVAAAVIALLAVVGVGGRLWDVKTRAARQARRRDRRRAELMDRTRRIADRVLELSDPVELAGDAILSSKYADATVRFDEAELAISEATTLHELDTIEDRLWRAEALLDEVRAGLRAHE